MRRVVFVVVLLACGVGCLPQIDQARAPHQVRAARLVLASSEPNRRATLLQPIDPDTLADVPGLEPLELPPCSTNLSLQPGGAMAVAATGATNSPQRCGDAPSAAFQIVDLNAWTWRSTIDLPVGGDGPLRLDVTDRWPMAWSADGRSVYALTTTSAEQRRLWSIDAIGATQPMSVGIDFVPARLDVAPNGSAIFVLGGQTAGNSRQGAVVTGSAFVAIYDPKTLVERIRVPLSGLSLGLPDSSSGSLSPGVTIAPDGSRYYVAHADRPLLDVVDTRAPRLERLERSVSLRTAPSEVGTRQAWLGISPDGSKVFAWHRAETPQDDLGLQVVDVHTWQIQTLDAVAERMGTSLDGRWLFVLDPPAGMRPGAVQLPQRGPRDPSGARLSVLDPSTATEVTTLVRDELSFGVGQYGADRLYISHFARRQRGDGSAGALVAYDTSTWQEIARRTLDLPGTLATTSPLW